MNNQIEINQNAGLGSHGNTFIAEQYNGWRTILYNVHRAN